MERAMVLPFSIDDSGSISSSNNPGVIWQSRVIAAVMTELNERVMRPSFGGSIKSSVFENTDTATAIISTSIQSVFGSFLPDLVFEKLEVSMESETGLLSITIYYTLPTYEKEQVTIKTGILNRSGDILQEL